ncbi:MAG: gamma-glutamyl-gamma-aminobutyrate hydrolase family protein [Nitrosopumilus sp.]|nr:gamma-glutamyl-gamma-aminobutyrate hydrolase family protein [Nitrosopumilus sp.]
MTEFKKIGITTRIVNAQGYEEKRDALSQDWIKLLDNEYMIPILIPNNLSDLTRFLEINEIQGIILSGGDNIGDDIERDQTETEIIEFGINKKIPIFGVCRGMQVINNFFEGKITTISDNSHVGKNHEVTILNEKIIDFIKNDKISVNSYHRNIIKQDDIGKSLKIFALDNNDKTVEGFFHETLPIMGVMWHPERTQDENSEIVIKFLLKNI